MNRVKLVNSNALIENVIFKSRRRVKERHQMIKISFSAVLPPAPPN